MKIVGRLLILLAASSLIGGFATLFWDEVAGEVSGYKTLSRTYAGNGGTAVRGATHRGGATELAYITYIYSVDRTQYTAHSIRFSGGTSALKATDDHSRPSITVYYSHYFPSMSVLDRDVYFFIAFLLALLGFGLIETQKWFLKHTKPVRRKFN